MGTFGQFVAFANLCGINLPRYVFLMETRLDNEGCNGFCGDLLFPNHFVVKYPNVGGGLALLWKGDVQLDVVNYMENHILAKVVEGNGFVWFLSAFYGWPEASQKVKS